MSSIFADHARDLYTVYAFTLHVPGRLMGGVPKDPRVIEGWLRKTTGVTNDQEIREMVRETLIDLGYDPGVDINVAPELFDAAIKQIAGQAKTNGFKSDERGLYIESRQLKALIKESVNIAFAGERWGPTKKAARAFVAERVFVAPDRLYLGRQEPDGRLQKIGHVYGPKGERSTLTYVEYVEDVTITGEVWVWQDCIRPDQWRTIWIHAERNGLGADRSQGYGTFEVTRWERVGG